MSYCWGATRKPGVAESPSPSIIGNAVSAPDPAEISRLAAELAPLVGVWQRLIDQHVPNLSGSCRRCTTLDASALPTTPWPCSIYGIAELARRRYLRDSA